MRHTMHRWFWAWDFEKEEKWLNEMSAKGLQLVAVGFCKYVFEESTEGEYVYRIELLNETPSNPESTSYIGFLEETGVEYIGAVMRWAYFRKKAADGAFELYSDIDSKIKHYKKIVTLLFAILPIEIIAFSTNINYYMSSRYTMNLGFIILLFTFLLLLGAGILRISKKINRLKKEKLIRE